MTPLTNKQVGERIREVRQDKGLSAEFVAEKLGMSKSNFTKYERGVAKRIDREFLLKVAEILNISVTEINGLDDIIQIKRNDEHSKITRQSLKDEDRILLDLWGKIGEDEQEFFRQQVERAAKERKESDDD